MSETTRSRLERAALELFEQRGFHAVTTEDIAARAGVTQRTFFRHFPTKLDVLLGDAAARALAFGVAVHARPPTDSLRDALVGAIESLAPDPAAVEVELRRGRIVAATAGLDDALRASDARYEAYALDWLQQRCPDRGSFELRVCAAMLVAARRLVVAEWLARAGRADVAQLARTALAMLVLPDERV